MKTQWLVRSALFGFLRWLVGGFKYFLFFHKYGNNPSQLTNSLHHIFRVLAATTNQFSNEAPRMACRKWWPPEAPGAPATWDAWAPRDGWSMAVCRRPCPWHIWWRPGLWGWENHGKSMGLLRFDGNFTMIPAFNMVFHGKKSSGLMVVFFVFLQNTLWNTWALMWGLIVIFVRNHHL